MKKKLFYIAAIALAVSCTDDMVEQIAPSTTTDSSIETTFVTLNLDFEGSSSDTRFSVTPGESDADAWKTEWEDGDIVLAYSIDYNAYKTLTYVAEGNSGGTFSGEVLPGKNRIYYKGGASTLTTSTDSDTNVSCIHLSPSSFKTPIMVNSEVIEIADEDGDGIANETINVMMQHIGAMVDFKMKFKNIPTVFDQLDITKITIGGDDVDGATDGEYVDDLLSSIYMYADKSVLDSDFFNSDKSSFNNITDYAPSCTILDEETTYSSIICALPFSIGSGQKLKVELVFNGGLYTLTDYIINETGVDFDIARATHCYLEKTYDLSEMSGLFGDNSWISEATPFADQSAGTESDPIEITTAGELAYLAKIANGFASNEIGDGLYYKLMQDIDLAGKEWYPIGFSSTYFFDGNFDGNGKVISNLTINSESSYQGLFGRASGDGKISNLTIKDPNISGDDYIGAICGYSKIISIEDCSVEGGSVSGNGSIGGVAGYTYSYITNCYNTSNVSTINTGNTVGGIAGYVSINAYIENCYNTGSVTGSSYVGGIVGTASSAYVIKCYNTGAITSGIGWDIGGVVGLAEISPYIVACYNIGSVTSTSTYVSSRAFGGVAGWASVGSTIAGCYSTGSVKSVNNSTYIGGVLGYCLTTYSSLSCYYLTSSVLTDDYGGVKLTTAAELNAKVDDMNSAANTALGTTDVVYYTAGADSTTLPSLFGETNTYGSADSTEDLVSGGGLSN